MELEIHWLVEKLLSVSWSDRNTPLAQYESELRMNLATSLDNVFFFYPVE